MNERPTEPPHIPLHLSMDDPEPMYAQIESQLRDFILAGQLPPGTRLPSVRALASYLACSVITTRRAYEDLERDGFIRTRQGIGSVVAEIPEEKMAAHRREPVEAAFLEAVRAGRRAGLTEEELRHIIEEALQRDDTNVRGGVS
jgi:GntR family transcriptional regulator